MHPSRTCPGHVLDMSHMSHFWVRTVQIKGHGTSVHGGLSRVLVAGTPVESREMSTRSTIGRDGRRVLNQGTNIPRWTLSARLTHLVSSHPRVDASQKIVNRGHRHFDFAAMAWQRQRTTDVSQRSSSASSPWLGHHRRTFPNVFCGSLRRRIHGGQGECSSALLFRASKK